MQTMAIVPGSNYFFFDNFDSIIITKRKITKINPATPISFLPYDRFIAKEQIGKGEIHSH